MLSLVSKRLNIIFSVLIGLSLAGYLVFSGLATSLDFEIEKALSQRSLALEEYEQLTAILAQAQGRENLIKASSGLNLVEVTLADGYVDIRPEAVATADDLAKNP